MMTVSLIIAFLDILVALYIGYRYIKGMELPTDSDIYIPGNIMLVLCAVPIINLVSFPIMLIIFLCIFVGKTFSFGGYFYKMRVRALKERDKKC